MKRLGWLVSLAAAGVVLAVGCADDDRPVVSLEPTAGETSQGASDAGAAGGGKLGSNGGAGSGPREVDAKGGQAGVGAGGSSGDTSVAHGGAGAGGVFESPGLGGAPLGASGDAGAAGAGGADRVDLVPGPPPFDGPYAVVYAAPSLGVDSRLVSAATFAEGNLIDFVATNGEHRAIGSAINTNTAASGAVQWGVWDLGTMRGTDKILLTGTHGFIYAIGALTTTLPLAGVQEYELDTAITATVGGGSEPLGVISARAKAAFATTTHVGITLDLGVDTTPTYTIATTGGTATPANSELTTWDNDHPGILGGLPPQPGTTGICTSGCSVAVQGYFAGANADNLTFVVHLTGGATSVPSLLVLKKKT